MVGATTPHAAVIAGAWSRGAARPERHIDGERPIELLLEPPLDPFGADGEFHGEPTVARTNVLLDHGPSFSTRREETRAAMENLIKAAPQIAPIVLDLYARAQDWPLAQEIAARVEGCGRHRDRQCAARGDRTRHQALELQVRHAGAAGIGRSEGAAADIAARADRRHVTLSQQLKFSLWLRLWNLSTK